MSSINQNLSDYRNMAGDARQQFNLEENLREAKITANDMHKNFVESLALPLATPLMAKPVEGLLKAGAKRFGIDGSKLMDAVKSGDVEGIAKEVKNGANSAKAVRQATEDTFSKTKNAIMNQVNNIKSKIPKKGLSDLVNQQESALKNLKSQVSSAGEPESIEMQDMTSKAVTSTESNAVSSNKSTFDDLFEKNDRGNWVPKADTSVSDVAEREANLATQRTSAVNDLNDIKSADPEAANNLRELYNSNKLTSNVLADRESNSTLLRNQIDDYKASNVSSTGNDAIRSEQAVQDAEQLTQAPESDGAEFSALAQKVSSVNSKLSSAMDDADESASIGSKLAQGGKAVAEDEEADAPEEEALGPELGLGLAAIVGAGAFLGTIFGSHKALPKLPQTLVPSVQFGVTE